MTTSLPLSDTESRRNEAMITYCGQAARVACDRCCTKAWGHNNRPREQLSMDEDDFALFADDELGDAPLNPGTYEGDFPKPLSPDDFPTKWCVRPWAIPWAD